MIVQVRPHYSAQSPPRLIFLCEKSQSPDSDLQGPIGPASSHWAPAAPASLRFLLTPCPSQVKAFYQVSPLLGKPFPSISATPTLLPSGPAQASPFHEAFPGALLKTASSHGIQRFIFHFAACFPPWYLSSSEITIHFTYLRVLNNQNISAKGTRNLCEFSVVSWCWGQFLAYSRHSVNTGWVNTWLNECVNSGHRGSRQKGFGLLSVLADSGSGSGHGQEVE